MLTFSCSAQVPLEFQARVRTGFRNSPQWGVGGGVFLFWLQRPLSGLKSHILLFMYKNNNKNSLFFPNIPCIRSQAFSRSSLWYSERLCFQALENKPGLLALVLQCLGCLLLRTPRLPNLSSQQPLLWVMLGRNRAKNRANCSWSHICLCGMMSSVLGGRQGVSLNSNCFPTGQSCSLKVHEDYGQITGHLGGSVG